VPSIQRGKGAEGQRGNGQRIVNDRIISYL